MEIKYFLSWMPPSFVYIFFFLYEPYNLRSEISEIQFLPVEQILRSVGIPKYIN